MKIIFLGYAVPRHDACEFSGLSVAGNKMQLSLLKSLADKGVKIECLTIAPVATYPIDQTIVFRSKILRINEKINAVAVGFINFPVIKQLHQTISMIIQASKIAAKGDIVLTFNAFPQVGLAAAWIKFYKKTNFVPVLADLPIDDLEKRRPFSRYLRFIFDWTTKETIRLANKVIVLNKLAADKFAKNIPFLVIEGGVDDSDLERFCALKKNKRNIVYTGSLTAYSGIRQLIEAMALIRNHDVTLEIYGSGPLEDEIASYSKSSKNIIFHGRKSHEEILKIQSEAFLLVNTRPLNDVIASVTFPSKIFEYMLSGTPVLSTRLNCFNSDFENKIFFVESNDPVLLAEKIKEIVLFNFADMRSVAKDAYLFASTKMHWNVQSTKILDFLTS